MRHHRRTLALAHAPYELVYLQDTMSAETFIPEKPSEDRDAEEMARLVEADRALDAVIRAKYERQGKLVRETIDDDGDIDGSAEGRDSVGVYLKEIGKVALLNAEQEVGLAKRVEAGLYAGKLLEAYEAQHDMHYDIKGEGGHKVVGEAVIEYERLSPAERRELRTVMAQGAEARNHLLEANLRLVANLAKRYTGRGMSYLDLIQEGNLGLVRAVEKFDYTKGFKFSTYATWWIRQAITRSLADQARTIRLPVHLVEQVNKLGRIQRELQRDLGRDATPDELANEMGIDKEKIQEMIDYARQPLSFDMPVGSDEEAPLGDFIEDEDAINPADAAMGILKSDAVEKLLSTLPEREADIMRRRHGLHDGRPWTLDEVGKVHGLTRERIRQIEAKTKSMLRHPSRSEGLQDYLDT